METNYPVTPWDDSEFSGSRANKDLIYSKLLERGYDVETASIQPPIPMMNVLADILAKLDEHKWLVFLANSQGMLDSVCNFIPIIFALNTKKSVANVSNNMLVRLFSGDSGNDFRDPNEYLKEISRSTLIVHTDIADGDSRMTHYKGSMSAFVKYRDRPTYKYLMTNLFEGTMNEAVKSTFFSTIKNTLGTSLLINIEEKAEYLYHESSRAQTAKKWGKVRKTD